MLKRICKTCKKMFYVFPCRIKGKNKSHFCSITCRSNSIIWRDKISKIASNRKWSKKTCNKISKANMGHKVTKEHRDKIRQALSGSKHYKFKGKYKNNWGYIILYTPTHPFAAHKHMFEHRIIMEQHIGRFLTSEEVVHHINRIKDDNRIENLQLMTKPEHIKLHRTKMI